MQSAKSGLDFEFQQILFQATMAQRPIKLTDEIGLALSNAADAATGIFSPTLRLGVTGLSRSGKTVFITALVHNLLNGGRLPGFAPLAEGRLIGAQLEEHPDRALPRFAYERHLEALTAAQPQWPQSTRRISHIRLTLKFETGKWISGLFGHRQLHLDIVDYPGEWLLDLPLLTLTFAQWSEQALERAQRPAAKQAAQPFLSALTKAAPDAEGTEPEAERLAEAFTAYLRAARTDAHAMSRLPPGRFLMPGDLEGSPALTFAPLPRPESSYGPKSLYAMFERRFEAYKNVVVRPFFRDHFARLDRQIVLVDALRAINAGPDAVADLENALTDVMACFRVGKSNPISGFLSRRIDRILFAASKADHVHSKSHDRLEAILDRLVSQAARRARFSGVRTQSVAMAAVRATRESRLSEDGENLDVIVGTPEKGEVLGETIYDGNTEIALFPGDLPQNPESLFQPESAPPLTFLRFLPPGKLQHLPSGAARLPYIRLDRALQFLIGDWLK